MQYTKANAEARDLGVRQISSRQKEPASNSELRIATQAARACEHCGRSFVPRAGSGGSPQRFCAPNCRLAFHSEGQRVQRRPACGGLPAVVDPAPEKAPAGAPEDNSDFDWSDDDSIVLHRQPAVAVYVNRSGGLTIRQERSWHERDDIIIAIAPENVGAFVDRLTDIIGIPSIGK